MPLHRFRGAAWADWTPYLLSILRILAAFLFVQHGATKLLGFPPSPRMAGATVPLASLVGVAGLLELVGGGFLLLGLFARPMAFLVSGEMAVAYFKAHAAGGFWPTTNGGELATLYCFVWLYFSAAGAGPWSLDALRGERLKSAGRSASL